MSFKESNQGRRLHSDYFPDFEGVRAHAACFELTMQLADALSKGRNENIHLLDQTVPALFNLDFSKTEIPLFLSGFLERVALATQEINLSRFSVVRPSVGAKREQFGRMMGFPKSVRACNDSLKDLGKGILVRRSANLFEGKSRFVVIEGNTIVGGEDTIGIAFTINVMEGMNVVQFTSATTKGSLRNDLRLVIITENSNMSYPTMLKPDFKTQYEIANWLIGAIVTGLKSRVKLD